MADEFDLRKFEKLKEKVERHNKEVEKAQGAKEQLLQQLNEFGCSSVKEAKGYLQTLEEKISLATKKYDQKFKQFEEELNDLPD